MASPDKRQISRNRHFLQALRHAEDGVAHVARRERNFRFHLLAAALVIIAGLLLHLSLISWCWIVAAVFAVLIAEMANTAVEELVDLLVGHHYSTGAKHIKDIAAGIVLLTSWLAVIIGLLVFVPALLKVFRR